VPAFWNIATALGSPVGVVAWWATAPADRVLGHMVSDRLYFEALVARGRPLPPGLTYPETLVQDATTAIVLPDQIRYEDARPFLDVSAEEFEAMRVTHPSPLTGIAHEFTYFLSTFETNRRFALRVLDEGRRAFGVPGDLLVLFRLVDKTSHTALQFSELVEEHGDASAEDLRKFGRVVTAAYRAVDSVLGEIRKAFPEANVIVVSDHGFQLEDEHGGYNHTRAPAGVFLAAGPAFRPGRVDGLSVYDVMPLLLYLKGFPQAEDLPGMLPAAALDASLLSRQPPRRVATYGDRYTPRPAGGTREADAEMRERLRALGYLQ
jgi:type I phosphodiesterase/nucleotide pyrophosphatase